MDRNHQPMITALLDTFWTSMEQAQTLPGMIQALVAWDRHAQAVVRRHDVPDGLRRAIQSWRTASRWGDDAGLKTMLAQRPRGWRPLDARLNGLPFRHRPSPDTTTLTRWREAGERFGYTHVSSSVAMEPEVWEVLLNAWIGAHAVVAERLDEPDRSMGGGRWAAHVSLRGDTDGGFEPVTRSIGLAFRPADLAVLSHRDDGEPGASADLLRRWIPALAHERGHALDFWLGERSISPRHPQHGASVRLGYPVSPDGHAWCFHTDPNGQIRMPLSGRQDALNTWLDTVWQHLPFVNGCLEQDEHAEYLFRSSEIVARFWEGHVRTFEDPPNGLDRTFPNPAMTVREQRALRDALLQAAGLPLRRAPAPGPNADDGDDGR